MTPRQLQASYERIKRRYENIASLAIYRAIRAQKADVLRTAKNDGLLQAWGKIGAIKGEPIKKTLTKLYQVIGSREAERVYNSLIKEANQKSLQSVFGINQDWIDEINRFLAEMGLDKLTTEITETTKARLLKVLMRGIQDGLSYSEIVNDLNDSQFDKTRSRLIARTECNRAMNSGHMIGAKSLPFQVQKQWLSANDFRVRGRDGEDTASHWGLNGIIVNENEPFTDPRNGAQLMYPGDSSLGAGADSVCNCRCSVLFLPVKDSTGRTVARSGAVNMPLMPQGVQPQKPVFVPAKSIEEAERFALKYSNSVDYKKLNLNVANEINEALDFLATKYNVKLNKIGYRQNFSLYDNIMEVKTIKKGIVENGEIIGFEDQHNLNINPVFWNADYENILKTQFESNWSYAENAKDVLTHEFGHILTNRNYSNELALKSPFSDISKYGMENLSESIAELFLRREKYGIASLTESHKSFLNKYLK